MTINPLKKLEALGQSIWLDFIKRDLISSGKLQEFIKNDGLRGMTSNPTIFEKAIAESKDYNKEIERLAKEKKDVITIYETLIIQDIQKAADEFLEVYKRTQSKDGYVSLEVNPHLAHDTQGTIAEARRLWNTVNRANVMIKVPATKAGLPAITQLISEGINVNVTLLFAVSRYQEVAEAYLAGLEARLAKKEPLHHIASVASFFLSRIDVLIDPLLEKISKKLQGQVAIASAKVAYRYYQQLINDARFTKLKNAGAQPQRLLWASTSTKNPVYSDVKYVEALIGVDTVNTVPLETLDAYRDHGSPHLVLENNSETAHETFQQLTTLGINIDAITQQLEDEGVDKFIKSFDKLTETLTQEI